MPLHVSDSLAPKNSNSSNFKNLPHALLFTRYDKEVNG